MTDDARAMLCLMTFRDVDGQDWTGRCYEAALAKAAHLRAEGKKPTVVHGAPRSRSTGVRIGHGWVELDDDVFDVTIAAAPIPKVIYYLLGEMLQHHVVAYDLETALERLASEGNYGPWEGPAVSAVHRDSDPLEG